jgi:hypothetical protein
MEKYAVDRLRAAGKGAEDQQKQGNYPFRHLLLLFLQRFEILSIGCMQEPYFLVKNPQETG